MELRSEIREMLSAHPPKQNMAPLTILGGILSIRTPKIPVQNLSSPEKSIYISTSSCPENLLKGSKLMQKPSKTFGNEELTISCFAVLCF
jgi:hypothetical protein